MSRSSTSDKEPISPSRTSCCIFCLKELPPASVTPERSSEQIKFRIMLQKYLEGRSILNFDVSACEQCWQVLEQVTSLYDRFKGLEVELEGMIWKLKEVMWNANQVPSKVASFLACYPGERERVRVVREDLVRKCSSKYSLTSAPVMGEKAVCDFQNMENGMSDFSPDVNFQKAHIASCKRNEAIQTINENLRKKVGYLNSTSYQDLDVANHGHTEIDTDCVKTEVEDLEENEGDCESEYSEDEDSDIDSPNSSSNPSKQKNTTDSYTCQICSAPYPTPQQLKSHERCHDLTGISEVEVQKCNQTGCSAYFRTKSMLNNHLRKSHGLLTYKRKKVRYKYSCSICSLKLESPSHQDFHFNSHHNTSNVEPSDIKQCPENCSAYFLKIQQLAYHLSAVHKSKEALSRCPDCGKQLSNRKKMKIHRHRVHKDIIKWDHPCTVEGCKRKFETKDDLQSHLNHNHKCESTCPDCMKVFQSEAHLKTHMRTHYKAKAKTKEKLDRPFVCHECGNAFKRSTQLSQHSLYHAPRESWRFECSACGKKSPTKFALEKHTRSIHTKEKPFICQYCGKSFREKTLLNQHVKKLHPAASKCLEQSTSESEGRGCCNEVPVQTDSLKESTQ